MAGAPPWTATVPVLKWVSGPAAWRWRKSQGAARRLKQLSAATLEGRVKSADDPARVATGIATRNAVANPRVLRTKNQARIAGLIAARTTTGPRLSIRLPYRVRGRSSSSRVPFQVAGRARRLSDADLGGRAMTIGPVEGAHVDPRPRLRNLLFVGAACAVGLIICLGTFRSASAATGRMAATPHLNAMPSAPSDLAAPGAGYWLAASDGGIFSEAGAPFKGSTGSMILNKPIVGMASTPDGKGYWLVASDGGIFNYGDAAFEGSAGGLRLNKPIVGMAPTADGKGYWLVASDGGIFNYGDAPFEGSAGRTEFRLRPTRSSAWRPPLRARVIGWWPRTAASSTTAMLRSRGSAGGTRLNEPVVGMASHGPDGKGYWLVASDGGIFNYGDAAFEGSAGGTSLNKPIVGMASTPDGKGYWLVASDGGIFNYGDSAFEGSAGGLPLNRPIVGMAVSGTSGPASKLRSFSTQPGGPAGAPAFSTQPVVPTVEDAAGQSCADRPLGGDHRDRREHSEHGRSRVAVQVHVD